MSAESSKQLDADTPWIAGLAGRFIVFDGPDGSGKSTQMRRFAQAARDVGVRITEVREPGGTPIGERIREILLGTESEGMCTRCELLLFMASRAQLVEQRILPALNENNLVVSDRYISSTLAYQGTAGGTPFEEIVKVAEIACGPQPDENGKTSDDSAWPDLTIVFDVDEQTAARRLNPLLDRMEQKGAAYHRRVRQGYLDQAAQWPERYVVIDARDDEETVFARTSEAIKDRLGSAAV